MTGRPNDLAAQLALDAIGDDRFRSTAPTDPHHVFGGLLLGQGLLAAARTVDGAQLPHVVHGSFVSAGRPGAHLDHHVERTRDGSSFATRRVTTSQGGATTFVLTAGFHQEEHGADHELAPTAGVPGPDGLAPGRYDNPLVACRDVPVDQAPVAPPHARRAWFRPRTPLPPDTTLHLAVLAYISDFGATRAVREPHADLADDAVRQSVSLDHSIWFHRAAELDGWLLSEWVPMATGHGRGLAIGTIRTEGGDLVATVAQEALLRHRADPPT